MRRIELTPEQQTQVRNMVEQGVALHAMSHVLGVSKSPIWRWMRDVGLRRGCQGCGASLEHRKRKVCNVCCPGPMDLHRFREYGITRIQFDEMWRRQNGTCALCPKALDETVGSECLAVDHNHDTGAVRGLLCLYCNRILGPLEARAGWLDRAAEYVKRR